jgi:lysophospholipase L1-like esterase
MASRGVASGKAVGVLSPPVPRRVRRWHLVAPGPAAALVTVITLVAVVLTACSNDPPIVALYTDSLGAQAEPFFADQLRGEARIRGVTVPGAALCDALDAIGEEAERRRARLAVIQFSGNNVTPCTQGPDGAPLEGAALVDRYEADARRAVELLAGAGVPIYFVGSPPTTVSDAATRINERYRQIADETAQNGGEVFFVDAHTTVIADDATFTRTLPCLPFETEVQGCEGGRIVVRAPDGVHFCPTVTGEDPHCPVWSSGAYRFGSAMAAPVLAALADRTTTTPAPGALVPDAAAPR